MRLCFFFSCSVALALKLAGVWLPSSDALVGGLAVWMLRRHRFSDGEDANQRRRARVGIGIGMEGEKKFGKSKITAGLRRIEVFYGIVVSLHTVWGEGGKGAS